MSRASNERISSGWLDTDVIIRFLLNDHPDHSLRAKTLVEKAERGEITLRITPHIICEVVYVLESQGYERKEASDALIQFTSISGIETENADEVMTALIWYRDKNVDFSTPFYTPYLGLAARGFGHSISVITPSWAPGGMSRKRDSINGHGDCRDGLDVQPQVRLAR
ncbi:MAG TPA: type II toxin-antitoxin system VapC family toxin [Firmicutes bacterium]|nr:type II toxin-antitoxin system VapC family toxin [Bacillota bacterium]